MWHGSISAQKESARRPELSAGITATGDTKLAQGLELSKKLLSGKGAWRVHGGGFAGCVQALTGMFTDINGLEDGFSSLSGRLGVKVVEGFEEYYSAARALKSVWGTAFPGSLTIPAALLFTAAVVISGLVYLLRGSRAERGLAASELIVMLLPLVWYAVAAQPSCIHAWFQYRSLAVLFFGAFLFISRAAVILKREKAK